MAIYRHAPNRAALLDGLVETVIGELTVSDDGASWQDQLRRTAHEFRSLARKHPHLVPLLVTRPLSTPLGLRSATILRALEHTLTLLIDAGFAPADALHVYRLYYGVLNGHILTELREITIDPEENVHLLRVGLHRLPAADFPHLRALHTILSDYDGVVELDKGLDILFAGLTTQLHPDTITDRQ